MARTGQTPYRGNETRVARHTEAFARTRGKHLVAKLKTTGTVHDMYDFTLDAPLPVPQAIRRRCLHCVGGESIKEVRDCTATPNICRLWPYRMGHGCDRTRDAKPPSRLKAIRQECLFCMGGSAQFVRECESSHCFLWPYRMGKKPDHMVTDAKRESGRRLAASVWLGVGAE